MMRLLLALALLAPLSALAQEETVEGANAAIQDRHFRMNHELDFAVAWLPVDPYSKGYAVQGSYVFHFSDSFAWQIGRGGYSFTGKTKLREQLERDFGISPAAFDSVLFFAGSDILWKPFYGKSSVLNRRLVHFEAHVLVGATVFMFTNTGLRPAVNFGGGLRIHHKQWLSYRVDLTDAIVISDKPFNVLTLQLMVALNFGATE